MDGTGIYKVRSRQLLATPGQKYMSIFTLPGKYCRCVEHLVSNDHVDCNATIVMFESNKTKYTYAYSLFVRKLASSFRRFRFINDDFLPNGHDLYSYDLVNLDTTSSLSENLLNFISKLSFLPNATLSINLCNYRNNAFFLNSLTNYYFCDNIDSYYQMRKLRRCKNYRTQITLAAINDALLASGYCAGEILDPYDYCEHVNRMTTYVFKNINKVGFIANKLFLTKEDFSFKEQYKPATKSVLDQSSICGLILSARSSGELAYVKRRINQQLEKAKITNKSVKMVIAGYKAEITKRGFNPEETILSHFNLQRRITNGYAEAF